MCTRPIKAFENPDGGRPIFGWAGEVAATREIKLPCGKCPECMKDYYQNWATRGSRELMRWESNLFITLTYNEENLPENKSLDKRAVQLFIKKVKKHFASNASNPIRQIYCGEYGTQGNRPHYHVLLFNTSFSDKEFFRRTDQGHSVFTSKTLDSLWGKGFAEFGLATPASIAYIFKYILKKRTRKEKLQPRTIEIDGITYEVAHEFIEASRNPGIGAHLKGSSSVKKGFLSVDGKKKKLPKYYLEDLRESDPDTYETIKMSRFDYASTLPPETAERRRQKEEAQKKLTDTKKRL